MRIFPSVQLIQLPVAKHCVERASKTWKGEIHTTAISKCLWAITGTIIWHYLQNENYLEKNWVESIITKNIGKYISNKDVYDHSLNIKIYWIKTMFTLISAFNFVCYIL